MKVMKRFLAMVLTLAMVATLFAGLTLTASAASYTDVLTRSTTGVTSTSYTSWSGKTGSASGVVYAGKSAGGNSSIQLRSSGGDEGVWTTANKNGYYVKSVSVTWNSSTSNGRTLNIYGSNSAFSGPTGGTLLGTIVKGTSTSYTLTSTQQQTYKYVMMKSASSAMYLTEIDVEWESGAATKTLSSIAISSSNHRSFTTGATFVGETVTATYSDSSTATVNATFSGYNMNSAGTQTVTASYTEGGVTKTATYQITVTAPTPYTLTYSVNGDTSVISGGSYTSGSSVSLPATVTAPAGYTFVGWLPTTYATNDTAPSGLITGTSYTMPAANTTLYAVFAISSGSGSGNYKLVESALSDYSGEYLIVYNNTNALNTHYGNQNANTYGTYTAISSYYSSSDKTIASNATTDALAYTAAKTTNGYSLKSKNNEYLGTTSTGSTGAQLRWDTTFTASQDEWTLAPGSIISVKTNSLAIRWNTGSPRFAIYATSNQSAIQLFKKEAGTTYSGYTTTVNTEATYYTLDYSASPAAGGSITCASASGTSLEEDTAVTLTATPAAHYTFTGWTVNGASAGSNATLNLTMDDDKTVVANFTAEPTYTVTVTPAAGGTMTASKTTGIYAGETITLTATPNAHYTFNGWQCTAGGATISGNSFTMPAANVTVTGSFSEAAQYTVTYYDKDGHVAGTEQVYAGETPASVPTITAPDGFVFKGWYGTTYNNVSEPTYVSTSAAITGNTEFHAVYAELGEGGSGSTQFTKVTTAPADWSGEYLLVYEADEDTGYVFTGVDAAQVCVEAEITNNTIAFADGMAVVEIDAVSGGYSLKVIGGDNNGKYMYGTSGQNRLNFGTTANVNTIAISNGCAMITSNTSVLRFNKTSSEMRFRYYKSTGYTDQQPVQLYKSSGASIEGYTTNPVATKINVVWKNGTETFESGKVAFGDPIVPPENDPTKTEAEQEYYTFAGWSETEGGTVITSFPTASAQLGDKTYYAVFTTTQKLTVTWKNYDNTTLDTDYCKSGDTPAYTGATPTKPADSSFYYTFSGWTPTVSAITSSITYTATFEQHDRFEMSASLSRNPIKVGKYGQVNSTLTDTGVATTAYTPTYTVADTSIATVDATGKITAKAIGSTTITVTYPDACDADGNPLTKTLTLQVIENASVGGYTLITEDMEDWSGDYIFAGRRTGRMADLNNLMIMTPGYGVTIDGDTYDACLEDGGGGSGLGRAENNASWLDLTISGTDATGSILSAYGTDDIVMSSTGDNDAGNLMVLDYIDEIDDSYAFTIELVDDINGYYTIRIKGTNYYLANDNMTSSGNNSLGYAFSVGDSTAPLWKIKMYENPVTTDGYTPPIVSITSVMNDERAIFFNPHQWLSGATDCPGDNTVEQARFRTYGSDSTTGKVGGTAYGGGANYSLYLYGNPNPFKAQIYYKGDQITIAESGKVNANAQTAQLTSALTPDIMNYPSWSQVGDPVWTIIENSDGNHMTIGENTGLITTNSSSVGSYALIQVAYTVCDNNTNTNHVVSTIAKVDVIAADTTYSTVIYELYSGDDTEVQYTIPNSMTELPLAAYVVNDATNDNSKTGDVVMGGTLSWSIVNQSSSIFGDISVDANGVMHIANVTKDSVVTVKVTGATGDNTAATDATYKVYIKAATYTVDIVPTPDSAGTHDTATDVLTVPGSADTAHLTYNVKDGNGNGPSSSTFTTAGYAWTISGDAQGALINSNGVLDFSEMDRTVDHTITVVVSRIAATDVNTGVISSGLTDTITVVIQALTIDETLDAIDDTVIIDWALPVTFNVLTNDDYNVEVDVTAGNLPEGVVSNGNGSFTYTPSGWQTTDQTFEYTIAGTVNGTAATDTATVTLKTADSVYYEDTYSGIFTFTGSWTDLADGSAVAEQTSSLDTADIFEYDANHEAYAQYSGGTAKMTTVSKGASASVSFTFAGTGFDVISATNANTGAVKVEVKDADGNVVIDPVTGKKMNQILDTFRGYVYQPDGYTRYGLVKVNRCNEDGTANESGAGYYDAENKTFVAVDQWYGQCEEYYNNIDAFNDYKDATGSYILKTFTSNWLPYVISGAEAQNYNNYYYQIPIIRLTGLDYGIYTVTLTPTYTSWLDRQEDGEYDFFFDGVRIYNPVADRGAEYKYIRIHQAVAAADSYGSGEIVACDHVGHDWSDWTFYSRARNTNSATTCNRGSFVQYCSYCGGVANTAYFHVEVTADDTELGVGGYMGYPSTTMLRYTLTADACENQAAIQAKLDAMRGSLTEYWSSNTRAIMTCMNNSNVVIGSGEGTTYATLQLKDPATQIIYASAIHSPMITVYADEDHVHTFGDWTHDADSDPSTHTHTCTGENCSFYETEECVFTEEVTLEPTQTTPGSKTCTCALCGYSYVEEIPALGGHTATFIVPEGATAPAVQTGNSVTMPAAVAAPAAYDAHSYTFVGWIGTTVSDTTTEQSFYAPGYEFELNEDMDFYALYTYEGEGSGNTYKKVTTELSDWSGNYMIVSNGDTTYALNPTFYSGTSGEFNTTEVTVSNNTITNSDPDLVWTFTPTGTDGQYSIHNSNGYLKITGTSSTNAALSSTADDSFTIGFTDSTDNAKLVSVSKDRVFSFYTTRNTFRTYASSNVTGHLYKQTGALTYTTNLAATCKHTNTTTTTVDATCTVEGSTTVTCNDCGETVSTTVLPALGHYYEPTETTAAGTTYTCTRCEDSYFEPAEFEVTYVLQPGVTVSGNSRSGNAITLPTSVNIPATYDAQTYTFVGWANATSADGTTDPTVYAKGEVVNITADTTFYPVYSYGSGSGSGSGDYEKVTKSADLTSGKYLVVYETGNLAFNGALSTLDAVSNTISVTISNGKIASNTTTDAAAFTFDSSNGSFLGTGGKYFGNASNSNALTSSNTALSNTVSISDGNADIKSSGGAYLRYNKTSGQTRFRYYKSSTYTAQEAIQLYKLSAGGSSSTTYTFELKSAEDNYTVTLNPATLTMYTEATASLTATLYNNGAVATAEDISFSSSNDNIVLVDNDGYVLAGETAGNATITVDVLAADGEIYTATCAVTVKEMSDNPIVNYIGSRTGNVKNWGTRGTTATFLTTPADEYYTGSYSYETLSALSGDNGTGTGFYTSALGTAIHNMLTAKQTSTTSYAATTSMYAYTDCIESGNKISSFYSAVLVGPNWDSGSTWNREHTWPNSKGLDGSDENDIMMLRPTAVSENSNRGNTAYGEGSGYYNPNSKGQNLHGDVARLMLQHLMRWGNTSKFYGTGGVMESREILLKWLAEDPVDTWELGRNDAVQRITGVRNVFVDYPELAFKLLGADVPANYTTPSKAGIVADATYSASAGSGYEPVTEAANTPNNSPRAMAPASARTSIASGSFNGAAIIDGKGAANVTDDFAAYGPNNEIYLAPGQGIVFSLTSDVTTITSQDLQIGAKAVNGTATAMDVASISNGTVSTGIKYLLENKAIASATEMYYELDTTQMGWNNGQSSVIVIYNSGEGVLSLTNLRYSTVNNNTLTMEINEVQTQKAAKMISIVYGEPVTDPDPIEPTPDVDLKFASAALALESDIGMIFYVDEDVIDSADGVYASFTKALYNEAGEITGYANAADSSADYDEKLGKYYFRFDGINPAEMGSAVTATLYGYRNGELITGKTINYSVLTYVNNMYAKSSDEKFNTLLADLVKYGDASQNYISYNIANLASAGVSADLLACATAEAPVLNSCRSIENVADASVFFNSAFLSLGKKVTVCYKLDTSAYEGSVADLELRISYLDIDGTEKTAVISGADFAEANGKYIAYFSDLNAVQMRTVLSAAVYAGDTCVSGTATYSIESYAQSKAAGSDSLAALVNAMMKFGDSAMVYFAK